MKEVLDRRIDHKATVLSGVVKDVFQDNGYTYLKVFVPTMGIVLPYVRTSLPHGTLLTQARRTYPVGTKVTIFKRAGQWFV
jgi:hypothetical protein